MIAMGTRLSWGLALVIGLAACASTPDAASPATPGPPSLSPEAGPDATPSFERPTPNPSPTFLVHAVRAGESLTSIARLLGTTARSIAFWNRDRYPSLDPDSATYAPDRIEVGWTLLLIPTEVVNEDELPDPTPTPSAAASPPPGSAGPAAAASPS